MAIDMDKFDELFESKLDPASKLKEVFGDGEWISNPKKVQWKGNSITVYDLDFFKSLISDWMARYGWTKEKALDEFFGMF